MYGPRYKVDRTRVGKTCGYGHVLLSGKIPMGGAGKAKELAPPMTKGRGSESKETETLCMWPLMSRRMQCITFWLGS